MTDRGRAAMHRTEDTFTLGPSSLHWDGARLTIDVDEMSTPHAQRIKGQVVITPRVVTDVEVPLTPDGAHIWRPFAPDSDIDVQIDRPGWTWKGHGYLDSNFGTRPLEADFDYWTWGRFPTENGAITFYDATLRDGSETTVALRFKADGSVEEFAPPPKASFRRTNWLVRRETHCDPGHTPRQVKPMLDAPFYNRAVVETVIEGETRTGVYEALDLNRFRGPWLMPMLAVRVPRRPGWRFS